ncbi:S-adenosyl-L-methionine-dependent methyltransferase [Amylocarpus encephaloides]|uniref:S-adenosyl-L-methionine-dependent methyltransferase n=1 Tax=Amylocarpus encephaloides TaxID=45428 RepID=A0A9P7YKT6_9HELO|nr:S-adenosyl-L-methionine-dependent methyltransferase [Amylocarpus encephaloides]
MAPLTAAKPEEPLTDSKQTSVTLEDDSPQAAPESYEEKHVHAVYSQIASHFSHTRYKPWPIISNFLLSLPSGSLGLDVGCGNGKYLLVNPNLYIIASDRSSELVSIASTYGDRKNETVVADGLRLPHPRGVFDFAISIAVVHHLSTAERRREAIRSILSMLTTTGKAMIYAWALEQKDSRRGWDEGGEQDVMVPWVMKKSKKGLAPGEPNETTYQRYYHLYRRGELEDDVAIVGGKVLEGGYEKDNWWCICGRGEEFAEC